MENLSQVIESKFLPYVEKPVRYTGGELNMVRKDLTGINLHGVLCFPDLYDIGMSHFGLQILYHIVNRKAQWALSRCFNPWGDAEKLMRDLHIPLYNLEYLTPVKNADWVGFSVQYELQFTNVINMLDLSGIHIFGHQRQENEPIIIAGGPCIANPEPMASFIDAFALGDGEQTIVNICTILENGKKSGASRQSKLQELSKIPGVYVPSLFKTQKKGQFSIPFDFEQVVTAAKIASIDNENYPEKPLVPLIEVVHSRLAVEVMRGCTRGCRFCSAGMFYRPIRERNPQDIIKQIRSGIDATGWREIGLLSLSTADYSCISGLLRAARKLKESYHISLGLPSTRIDALSEEQMDLYESVTSTSSLTIAPEAGSMRLRRVINKDFTDETIYETVKRLLDRNVQTLKLYFMVGLPTECQDDIDAIIKMVTVISGMVRSVSKRRMVHVAISPFSPKAHTPFGREPMTSIEVLLQRSTFIKHSLRALKNVKVSYRDPQMTLLETVMARGDRTIGELIYKAWQNGARFDGWDECFNLTRWRDAAEELQINLNIYLQMFPEEMILPWAAVSTGVSEQFLLDEAKKALQEATTGDCRKDGCSGCGVCNGGLKNSLQSEYISDFNSIDTDNRQNDISQPLSTHNYRIFYQKSKDLRFLGHMDMVSLFHRALSMAGVSLAYSNGFNPHAKVSFGPPLPLGVYGDREAFDIVTTEPLSAEISTINSLLPDRLKVIEISPLTGKELSLSFSIVSALYDFCLPSGYPDLQLEEKIVHLLSEKQIEITIEKKGEKKRKDIRAGIIELHTSSCGFNAVLSLAPGISCKPSELAAFLCPQLSFADFLVARRRCFLQIAENVTVPL